MTTKSIDSNSVVLCSVCGFKSKPIVKEKAAARDTYSCVKCKSMLRHKNICQVLLDELGRGRYEHFNGFINSELFKKMSIYEVGIKGPITTLLKGHENYTQSYYWHDQPLGAQVDDVYCQDLRSLTFRDNSFDAIISVDVMEHVFEPRLAFSEIGRVLKPGGVHVFSIPFAYPPKGKSFERAKMTNGKIEYMKRPYYHIAGNNEKSLVVTDWGTDIIELHKEVGLDLKIVRRSAPAMPQNKCATFVARKPSLY